MINNKIIKTIKEREMDRKDFLKFSGLAVLSIVGFKSIVTLLTPPDERKVVIEHKEVSRGFGGGKYGA